MTKKRIKKSEPNYFEQVKKLLPSSDTFHDQKAPIVWITRKHLERIEKQLQRFEETKKHLRRLEKMEINLRKVKESLDTIISKKKT